MPFIQPLCVENVQSFDTLILLDNCNNYNETIATTLVTLQQLHRFNNYNVTLALHNTLIIALKIALLISNK